jgi:hypothetical protein
MARSPGRIATPRLARGSTLSVAQLPGTARDHFSTEGSPRSLFVVILLLSGFMSASAQVPAAVKDTVEFKSLSLSGYPYVFYSPETEFALGGALVGTYRETEGSELKPSNVTLSGYYSVKDQYDLYLVPELFFEGGKYYLTGFLDYARMVDKFWGIGNSTPDIPDAGHIRAYFALNVDFEFEIGEGLRLGANYDLNKTDVTDKQTNPFLLSDTVAGSNGGFSSGVGLAFSYDGRDNLFWPLSGGYYKLSTLQCMKWLGSDFSFNRIIVDLRQFVGLGAASVLGLQVYGSRVAGSTPFYQMPLLGGGYIMRGYYLGRYRDAYYLAGQAEYRLMFAKRWGAVAFIGAGEVGSKPSSFQLTHFKPTYGFGLRFALDPKEKLNVRVDICYGRDTEGNKLQGVYFNVKEAF